MARSLLTAPKHQPLCAAPTPPETLWALLPIFTHGRGWFSHFIETKAAERRLAKDQPSGVRIGNVGVWDLNHLSVPWADSLPSSPAVLNLWLAAPWGIKRPFHGVA